MIDGPADLAASAEGACGVRPLERVMFARSLSQVAALRIVSGAHFLAGHSRVHARSSPEGFERGVSASLSLGQFHYYTDPSGSPLAFCNWAWLDEAVLADVLATHREVKPDEFQSGDRPYLCEVLAPFGHCWAVMRDLRRLAAFKNRRIPGIRARLDEAGQVVARVHYFLF